MRIVHKFESDLVKRPVTRLLTMVQDDANSRYLEITLLENGVPWGLDSIATVTVRYRKPDGTKSSYIAGSYDAASSENIVGVRVDPAVLDQAGKTLLQVVLSVGDQSISIFYVEINVQQNVMA